MRYAYALARVIFGLLILAPVSVAAGDGSPVPSAIDTPMLQRVAAPASGFAQEPFAGVSLRTASGALLEKWNAAKIELNIDIDIIAACRTAPDTCESDAAKRLIAIMAEAERRGGRARIGEINRAVNLAIAAVSDASQYGVEDKWASPLMTFTSSRGDCEDYALAKYAALRLIGFAESDLRLLIVRLPQSGTDHAVLSVRQDGRWLILDNRRFAMLDSAHLDAMPLFSLREDEKPPVSMAATVNRDPYLL